MKKKEMDPTRFTASYLAFCCVFMALCLLVSPIDADDLLPVSEKLQASAGPEIEEEAENKSSLLLMIDPGHGGEDGGAVAESGITEKELNLAVAENIADLSLIFGIPYSMTRDSDKLLYDKYGEFEDYTGKKKSLDLKNRLRSSDEEDASMFLSIHMNKFTDSRYSGLQVYYSPNNEGSRVIAEAITAYNRAHLQRDNERAAKSATSSIYLLHRLQIPAVLVECGFLSNPDETARLQTETYRASLACTVFTPVLEYCTRDSAKQ